jgi:hypothetical protein
VNALNSSNSANTPSARGVRIRDIAFVVRSAGERTLDASVTALRTQVTAAGGTSDQITVVAERPFSAAVRRTLEIGVYASERGHSWTVGMDADVLLTANGVEHLRAMCGEARPDSFTVTGLMLCKFYGGFVFRGVHCYRGSLLTQAIGQVGRRTPGGPDPELKPESAVVHAMAALGHGYEGVPRVLAAHDFEQSYGHIYLKMRLRGRREAADGDVASLRVFCERHASAGDADFRVALWGIQDGVADASNGVTREYDWFAEYPEFERRLNEAGMREKPPMMPSAAIGLADRLVNTHAWPTDDRTPRWIRAALTGRAEMEELRKAVA